MAWDGITCSEQPSACFMNIIKLNHVLEVKKGQYFQICQVFLILLATTVYIYFSAVRRLIVINHIQNKSFCLNNICVCSVYIYYVYINIHTYSIYFENIYVFTCLYYIQINYMINKYI